MIRTDELFDLARVPRWLRELLEVEFPWQALERLDRFGATLEEQSSSGGGKGAIHPTAVIDGPLIMEEGAEVGPYAYLTGPVYLAADAKVGHTAYLRGPVVLGEGAHVMHASEVKRSVLLRGARAPHFNYVGDSILGHDVNLGAGVKLANFKTFGDEVKVAGQATGLRKFGAALGDNVSIGCNAVLSPGTVVGKRTIIYHGATVRGVVAADTIVKLHPALEEVARR